VFGSEDAIGRTLLIERQGATPEVATVVGVAVSTDAADAGGAESADLSAVRTARRWRHGRDQHALAPQRRCRRPCHTGSAQVAPDLAPEASGPRCEW